MNRRSRALLTLVISAALLLAIPLGISSLMNQGDRDEPEPSIVPAEYRLHDSESQAREGGEYGPEEEMRILQSPDYVRLYPGVVLRSGDPSSRNVALTFDDGPDNTITPRVLDVLHEYGVKATFFVVGENIERYPAVAYRIVREGHLLASHGYTHDNFANLAPEQIRVNLRRNAQLIRNITGEPVTLFRPPYGALNARAIETIAEEGYKLVLWNVDSLDWRSLSKEEVLANVLPQIRRGSVILQHSAGAQSQNLSGTVEALPVIIREIRSRGLEPVTVDVLLELDSDSISTTWYMVQPGDTLYTIARSHGTTVADLMQLNPGIDPNSIYAGQQIVISGVSHPGNGHSDDGSHTVRVGDTLWQIARDNQTTVDRIRDLNPHIEAGNLLPGQVVALPATVKGEFYRVQPGDSYWSIAQKKGVPVSQLERLNPQLDPVNLRIGTELRIR